MYIVDLLIVAFAEKRPEDIYLKDGVDEEEEVTALTPRYYGFLLNLVKNFLPPSLSVMFLTCI